MRAENKLARDFRKGGTPVQHNNRTRKPICRVASLIAVLLALTSPWFQQRTRATNQMDDDMDMRWYFRPIGMVGALVDDGFVINPTADKAYASIDYPGALVTSSFGINNAGNIVGFYQDASKSVHGFFFNRVTGSLASIDNPDPVCTTGTDARGINKPHHRRISPAPLPTPSPSLPGLRENMKARRGGRSRAARASGPDYSIGKPNLRPATFK